MAYNFEKRLGPLFHGLAFFFLLTQPHIGGTGVILETFDATAAVDLVCKNKMLQQTTPDSKSCDWGMYVPEIRGLTASANYT